jgi:branched-subunit amino acid transport protein
MQAELLLLFLVVGVGNYLMRFLPLFWALRRGTTGEGSETSRSGLLDGLLPFVGPSVVVALLVASLLPEARDGTEVLRTGLALLPTLLVAVRSGNLALTVLVGVLAYWLVSLAV